VTEFIEARNGVPFKLHGKNFTLSRHPYCLHLDALNGWSMAVHLGGFVAKEWEVARPYPTNPLNDEIDPDVVAVLVKRSKRYRIAAAARDFIKGKDLHEDPGPVALGALFRSMGGLVIQPGGLSDRDVERLRGLTARIHGRDDITLFLAGGEDEVRRRELMALTIAVFQELRGKPYEDGFAHAPLDLRLGDARSTHPDAHLFASMLLVPQDPGADRSIDIATAEEIGAELKVDPATVQDAYQLWHEITHPEQPTF
jgi:hypothetical protein